ncbi:MAG: hypothetical protein V3U65_11515 [Granulosicoccaceae bacterium]
MPFFSTKAGTGLVLSLAHASARQSSGYFLVTSKIDTGTTVKLYLSTAQIISEDIPSPLIRCDTLSVPEVEDIDMLRSFCAAQY